MGYGDTYIQGVTHTLQRQGDAAADARLRQGAISAQTLGQLGQVAAQLPGQMHQAQADAAAKQELALATQLAHTYKAPDGQPDWSMVAGKLKERNPMSQVAAEIEKRAQAQQAATLNTQNIQSQIDTRTGELGVQQTNAQTAASKLAADQAAKDAAAKAAADLESAIKGILTKHVDPAKGVITDWSAPIAELASQGFEAEAKQFADLAKAQAPAAPKNPVFREVMIDGKPTTAQWDDATQSWKPTNARPIPPQSASTGASGSNDAKAIADAIIRGEQPPELTGLYRLAGPVRAELAKQGYNQSNALTDWRATQKHVATLNGAKITQMRSAIATASDSLDVIDDLAGQWKGGKFPLLNKANLALAKNGAFGKEAQSIATQLDGQITDVVSELGQVYMGGNSPTDHALGLAEKNLKADWSEQVLKDMTKLARTNLAIRRNSIIHSGVAGSGGENPYDQTPKDAPNKVEEWVIDPKTNKLVKKGGG